MSDKKKKSKRGLILFFFVLIMLIIFGVVLFFGWRMLTDKTKIDSERIESLEIINKELESRIQEIETQQLSSSLGKFIFWGILVVCLTFLFYSYMNSKQEVFGRGLTLDQAKKKCVEYLKNEYNFETLNTWGDSYQRQEGSSNRYMVISCSSVPRNPSQAVNYRFVKHIVLLNGQWDYSRIESFPEGYTNQDVLDDLYERELHGFAMEKGSLTDRIQSINEGLKSREEILKQLGIDNNEE